MLSLRSLYQARLQILVGLVVLIGFGIRLGFLLGKIYHIDEFITMLAATMVAEKGLPILPSGLLYDSGFLFSMISGLFVAPLGFAEEIARWPSLLVSTLTIAAYFTAGRRLFNSRLAGLIAATLIALDGLAIVWGGRARMYAFAHFFVLLSLVFLLEATLKQPNPKGRYLFLLCLAAAILSHMVTFLIIPSLLLTLLIFTLVYNRTWFRITGLWREVLAAIIILGGTLGLFVAAQEQTGNRTAATTPGSTTAATPFGLGFLQRFFDPGLAFSRFDDLIYFFTDDPDYVWLLPFVALAIGIGLFRLWRRQHQFTDIAVLFLTVFGGLVVLEQGLLFSSVWQKTRYLFLTALPAFILVSAVGLAYPLQWIESMLLKAVPSRTGSVWIKALTPVVGLVVLLFIIAPDDWGKAYVQGTGNYNSAFEYVRQNMAPEDKIMSAHPSAAYLFAGQSDYYASQSGGRVLKTETADEAEESLVDRYIGGDLVDSVEQYNQVLAQAGQVWFVIDEARLYSRFDEFFTQQFFAQMDYVHRTGQIYVFRSKAQPVPVPPEPAAPLNHDFFGLISLQGYSLNTAHINHDGMVSLGLFWRPLVQQPLVAGMPKVFVQLRDRQNQVVAQADHFFYNGLLTLGEWQSLYNENEWLRDTAQLPLPPSLNAGPYKIFVGLYNPETQERVPITNDSSGENAAIIPLPDLK